MANLLVASWDDCGGKTTLCAGIGRHLQEKGKKVGYLKPVVVQVSGDSSGVDKDAQFIQQALGLSEPVENLCPFCLNEQDLEAGLKGADFPGKLMKACNTLGADKDLVLLDGLSINGKFLHASSRVADILDAKVIIVVSYSGNLSWESISSSAGKFAQRLLGIVINKVPQKEIDTVRSKVASQLKGINVLGILPEEKLLLGISVAELAEALGTEVLCCPEASNELVESVMIGAMNVGSGVDYFARKNNKAVVARSERPDMQLAALATSTKCLILSGGKAPIPQVLSFAEDKGTAIIASEQDVPSIVSEIEKIYLQSKFRQQVKLDKMEQILAQHFDFQKI